MSLLDSDVLSVAKLQDKLGYLKTSLLHSDVLCPYCLEELRYWDLKYICPICKQEVLPSKSETITRRIPRCKNKGCHGAYASEKKCKKCDAELPKDILEYDKYLRFSLIGITGSGKTNFLTTMIHELKAIENFPLVISWMDAQTGLIFQENENLIYEFKTPVNPNPPGVAPRPQQWKIKDRARMTQRTIPSYSLTIFDGAGEDCTHTDPLISRYISGSKELIILFDPLALSSFSKTLSDEILRRSTRADHLYDASTDMVNEIANYIRQSCNIPAGNLIDRDVAVVFTKIDEVSDTFGFGTVMQPSPHAEAKGFVKADSDAVDAEIREWLLNQGHHSFMAAIETNFRGDKVKYFGISSFGYPPKEDGSLNEVKPHRVLDPLFWMLANENIIPTIIQDEEGVDAQDNKDINEVLPTFVRSEK